jgi:hypothetical protein
MLSVQVFNPPGCLIIADLPEIPLGGREIGCHKAPVLLIREAEDKAGTYFACKSKINLADLSPVRMSHLPPLSHQGLETGLLPQQKDLRP